LNPLAGGHDIPPKIEILALRSKRGLAIVHRAFAGILLGDRYLIILNPMQIRIPFSQSLLSDLHEFIMSLLRRNSSALQVTIQSVQLISHILTHLFYKKQIVYTD
jgi:hypothetical protein